MSGNRRLLRWSSAATAQQRLTKTRMVRLRERPFHSVSTDLAANTVIQSTNTPLGFPARPNMQSKNAGRLYRFGSRPTERLGPRAPVECCVVCQPVCASTITQPPPVASLRSMFVYESASAASINLAVSVQSEVDVVHAHRAVGLTG